MSISQGKARVRDQVWEAVGSAEKSCLGVVGKAVLCALHGGLQGQGWSTALLVLRTTVRSQAIRSFYGSKLRHSSPTKSKRRMDTSVSQFMVTNLLQALVECLEFVLLPLCEALAFGAGGEAGDICVGCLNAAEADSCSESCGGQNLANLGGILALC
jgi:hypothetical protein